MTSTPVLARSFDADVAVVGAGPTGTTAALALRAAGLEVALVAPEAGPDPRTTALLEPSVALLRELGVWSAIEAATAPLRVMRIVDDTGYLLRAPEVSFIASEIGLPAFGHNVPNDDLNGGLAARLTELGGVRSIADKVVDLDVDEDRAVLQLEHGRPFSARLVVAADGKGSTIRTLAGFATRTWSYRQSALVTTLTHDRPHRGVSTEFHTAAGPFTLVPLPGDRSSLVWVDRPEVVDRCIGFDDGRLGREITRRSHGILGSMRVDGPRGAIPLSGCVATAMARNRVALVGEAGHRFPPIGAQGLNLGLRDVATLADIMARAVRDGADPGGHAVLERYAQRRFLDVTARTAGVDLLNRSLLTDALPVSLARGLGLYVAQRIGPLRRTMMRAGLGPLVAPALGDGQRFFGADPF